MVRDDVVQFPGDAAPFAQERSADTLLLRDPLLFGQFPHGLVPGVNCSRGNGGHGEPSDRLGESGHPDRLGSETTMSVLEPTSASHIATRPARRMRVPAMNITARWT